MNKDLLKYVDLAEKYIDNMELFDKTDMVMTTNIYEAFEKIQGSKLKVAKSCLDSDGKTFKDDALLGGFSKDYQIILNDKMNYNSKRMLIAYSIPYFTFNKTENELTEEYYKRVSTNFSLINRLVLGDFEEKEIEELGQMIFALMILIPEKVLKEVTKKYNGEYEKMANHLVVPYTAISARLKVKNWLNNINLNEIKKNDKQVEEKTKNNKRLIKKLVDKRWHF